jgi:putative ABC transport system permease protein
LLIAPLTVSIATPTLVRNLFATQPQQSGARIPISGALNRDWRDRQHAFEETALVRAIANFNLTGERNSQEPERVLGARVSANLFRVLGVQPMIGRAFRDGEDHIALDAARGADLDIVILSHGLWKRRFGSDASIVGASLLLSGRPHTVVP